jgi:hypothetical protein
MSKLKGETGMSGRSIRTVGSVVAGITAVIYFGLVCLAATCSLALPVSAHAGGHEQHHDHETAHSSFCAWACQATPESGLVALVPADVFELVVSVPVVSPVQPFSVSSVSLLPSRAPPVLPFG